jgi:hypothetical protein
MRGSAVNLSLFITKTADNQGESKEEKKKEKEKKKVEKNEIGDI